MGQPAEKGKAAETPEQEQQRLLKELDALSCEEKALKKSQEARKARLQALMSERGEAHVDSEHHGSAGFSPRRSFSVVDKTKLARRVTKALLAEGFKPNAAIVKSLTDKGISLAGIIRTGVNDTFSYTPPSTKAAKKRRAQAIEASRTEFEEQVAALSEKV